LTHQQLDSAAAHQILRSIAHRNWTKLDQSAGAADAEPIVLEAQASVDLFEHSQADVERAPSAAFPWLKLSPYCSMSRQLKRELGVL
jgi:hypothetical protein